MQRLSFKGDVQKRDTMYSIQCPLIGYILELSVQGNMKSIHTTTYGMYAGLSSHTHWECDTHISLPSHSHTRKWRFCNISHSFS